MKIALGSTILVASLNAFAAQVKVSCNYEYFSQRNHQNYSEVIELNSQQGVEKTFGTYSVSVATTPIGVSQNLVYVMVTTPGFAGVLASGTSFSPAIPAVTGYKNSETQEEVQVSCVEIQ